MIASLPLAGRREPGVRPLCSHSPGKAKKRKGSSNLGNVTPCHDGRVRVESGAVVGELILEAVERG
jgi:hypothetical protein